MSRRTAEQSRASWAKHKERTNARRAEKARAANPNLPPYKPRAPRGPCGDPPKALPPMHVGHELAGVSTLTDGDGTPRAEWNKTRVAGADPMPLPEGFDLPSKISIMSRGDDSEVVRWKSYKADEKTRAKAIAAAIKAHVAEFVHEAPMVRPPDVVDSDLLVAYPIGDPHIGLLAWGDEVGEHFDTKIAQRELCECMRQMVARAPAAERAIVTNLGDFWHAQDDNQRTPKSGNKLDVDGRAGKVGRVGLAIFETLIDTALTKHAHVTVRSIPGNHDPHSAFWLPEVLLRTYRNEPRVTVEDGFNPYQFDVFGANLLGWAHGDGAKIEALGEIMAQDAAEHWREKQFRYWNTGHVHHLTRRELRTCVVDTHRTLAGRDAWHHHSGYRSGRSLSAITYHKRFGFDGENVVGVERVRDAILSRKAA